MALSFIPHRNWLNLTGLSHWIQTWQSLDRILLATVMVLSGIGILAIQSTYPEGSFWVQQLQMLGFSLLPCLGLARRPYTDALVWHWGSYGLTLIALVVVLLFGTTSGGSERWIVIAGVQIQPSELAKLGVILTLSAILHHSPVKRFQDLWVPIAVVTPPWILIFLQPNLGTALVFLAIVLVMLYWAGARLSWIILIISPGVGAILYGLYASGESSYGLLGGWLLWCLGIGILALVELPWGWLGSLIFSGLNLLSGQMGHLAWGLLKPYQQKRLLIFMDPNQDPLGSGYHLIQSQIAIGSGGVWGKGWQQGSQTQLDFIPEQHTDFIFSAIGEEWGFVGTVAVLGLLWILCLRLILIAQSAKDNFGSLVAIGVFAMILFQSTINIGMTIGLAPITGLPLPFVSYGRSALLTNFLALGIVESIYVHRQRANLFR
jgi:rod shape determining protein RodA